MQIYLKVSYAELNIKAQSGTAANVFIHPIYKRAGWLIAAY